MSRDTTLATDVERGGRAWRGCDRRGALPAGAGPVMVRPMVVLLLSLDVGAQVLRGRTRRGEWRGWASAVIVRSFGQNH